MFACNILRNFISEMTEQFSNWLWVRSQYQDIIGKSLGVLAGLYTKMLNDIVLVNVCICA